MYYTNELYHHGIKGQRWGVRRFQNEDGSLTDAGKKRYLNADGSYNEAGKRFKAKQYENKLINLSTSQAILNTSYANAKYDSNRATAALSKMNRGEEKAKKLLEANELRSKELRDIENAFDINRQKIADLLNEIESDSDLVWGTYYRDVWGSNKGGYYTGSSTTGFKVRSSSNKKKDKIERNKTFYKNTPYREEYYFY